jgi:hypothetical protein
VKSRCSRGRAKLAPLLASHRRSAGDGNPGAGQRVEHRSDSAGSWAEEVAGDDS